jgi:hypothetical protein
MAQVDAFGIASVEGSAATSDGNTSLIRVKMPDGKEIILAFPLAETFKLISAAAYSATKSREILGLADYHHLFSATKVEVGTEAPSDRAFLSIGLENGAALNFLLSPGMPDKLFEMFATLRGRAVIAKLDHPAD